MYLVALAHEMLWNVDHYNSVSVLINCDEIPHRINLQEGNLWIHDFRGFSSLLPNSLVLGTMLRQIIIMGTPSRAPVHLMVAKSNGTKRDLVLTSLYVLTSLMRYHHLQPEAGN